MSSYEFVGFRFDSLKRQLRNADGKLLELPARSVEALALFLERRGEDVSKEQLTKALWPNTIVEENNLNQAIFALRRALGDDANAPRFILTLPGRGYRFIGESSAPTSPSTPPRSMRLLYAIVAVAVLAIGAAAFFWLRGQNTAAAPTAINAATPNAM